MTQANAPAPVRVGFFSRSVVSRVARERGLFAAHGLAVTEHAVPSSVAQFTSLRAREFDLIMTSPDNVAAYRLAAFNPLHERLDVRIVLGIDAGLGLSLVAAPSVTSVEALRGRTIGVDVPFSGFALALFAALRRHGLQRDDDYRVVSLGSTPRRREALASGRCDATLLNAGHDIRAESAGCRRLLRIADLESPYLGTVLAAPGAWLDDNVEVARRFVDAWLAAVDIVLEPDERPFVMPLLRDEMSLDALEADEAYRMLRSSRDGLIADGAVAIERILTILRVRNSDPTTATDIDTTPEAVARSGIVDGRLLRRIGAGVPDSRLSPNIPG